MIRLATRNDLPALLELEANCFATDRFSRRTWLYILTKAQAVTLIAEVQGQPCGACTLLFRRDSRSARLYSIAVAPKMQRQGIARQLLLAAEQQVLAHGCRVLTLEVRADNEPAVNFYQQQAYALIGRYEDYYEDQMDALRFSKIIQ